MSSEFKVEIINPEKSFFSQEDINEVVLPAFEGEMGILKDHIPIISFLKPGIIKIFSKSGEKNFFVEDGIVEFRNDNLSILTSSIFDASKIDKTKIDEILKHSENVLSQKDLDDQKKYLIDQKIDVLKLLSLN